MALTEAQKQARYKYAQKSLKRIPLDVQKEKYEEIKVAADAAGETVNGYIKKAIDERMYRNQQPTAATSTAADLKTSQQPDSNQQKRNPQFEGTLSSSGWVLSAKTGNALLIPENINKVDFSRIKEIAYQCELVDIFGSDGLEELYKLSDKRSSVLDTL